MGEHGFRRIQGEGVGVDGALGGRTLGSKKCAQRGSHVCNFFCDKIRISHRRNVLGIK
jgi:hypothetical protein